MGKERHIRVTGQRKQKPDYRKLSAALLAYVAAQAEADAAAQADGRAATPNKPAARTSGKPPVGRKGRR